MASHSVTCHPAEVRFPPLAPAEADSRFSDREGCKAELTYVTWKRTGRNRTRDLSVASPTPYRWATTQHSPSDVAYLWSNVVLTIRKTIFFHLLIHFNKIWQNYTKFKLSNVSWPLALALSSPISYSSTNPTYNDTVHCIVCWFIGVTAHHYLCLWKR